MNYYKAYGLNIGLKINSKDNTIENDESTELDVIIQLGNVDSSLSKEIVSNKFFKISKGNDNEYYLYWKGVGTFEVSDSEIVVSPEDNADVYTLNSYIWGPVIATLLYLKGFLVLHASAVKIANYAVAFLGYSGIGKSTLAMALNNQGYSLITDDILVIQTDEDKSLVFSGLPQTKLSSKMINIMWDNQEIPKIILGPEERFHCTTPNFSCEILPLKRVYIIEEALNSYIENPKPQKALMELIHNSYCFIFFQNKDKSLNFKQCSKLMDDVTIRSLKVNKSFEELSELVKKIENDCFNDLK
ncbi:MAG: serine kinase [Methanobacterium sp.]|uniref:hypothetical protein n=1 Tax=Methanobacterium sp. TaxID=2164 RepID=UPI003D65718C|nr:serine kinase [Methanobacterium sp.]